MIEQNTTCVAKMKNCGDLFNKSRQSIIWSLPQSYNIQIELSVNIKIFEIQAILFRYHVYTEK